MSKIGNYYIGLQEDPQKPTLSYANLKDNPDVFRESFCTDREILNCKGNFAFRIFIRKLMSDISSYVDSEIHPLLLEREYIEWEISRSKQDLIRINRRIEDEM